MCRETLASGRDGDGQVPKGAYTRDEVSMHDTMEDAWLIYEDKVYDVSKWAQRHPGGRVIFYYKGEDATEVMNGFHPDVQKMRKYLAPLLVGTLTSSEKTDTQKATTVDDSIVRDADAPDLDRAVRDFRLLRDELEAEGRFQPNVLSYALIYTCGWYGLPLAAFILCISQIHYVVIGVMKGASSWWWKTRHNKFVSYLPFQQYYWHVVGVPVVTNFLFLHLNEKFMAERGLWEDIIAVNMFYLRFDILYQPLLGWKGAIALWMLTRLFETHWFTWVTSMNINSTYPKQHLPMPIIPERHLNWIQLQLQGTQNVEGGVFNDWFTGHLNYQIEHHLFPKMPRHQYPYIADRVRVLCENNGVPYRSVPLLQSFRMILDKLASVGSYYAEKKAPSSSSNCAKIKAN